MNTDKTTFKCKFNFEIDGVDYFIERRAKKNRKGQVKVDVDFWSEIGGEVKNLNGEQRRETNKSTCSKQEGNAKTVAGNGEPMASGWSLGCSAFA